MNKFTLLKRKMMDSKIGKMIFGDIDKIQLPKTRYEDYTAFLRETYELNSVRNSISPDEYSSRRSEIAEEYKKRFSPDDLYMFDNFFKYLSFFVYNEIPLSMAFHERSHFKEAKKKGHEVTYGLFAGIKPNSMVSFNAFTLLDGSVSIDDYVAIASAPKDMSPGDKEVANLK